MRPRRGLTLIELLVAVAIVGIVTGLVLSAARAARESARRTRCTGSLRQIGLALHHYHEVNNAFPPGSVAPGSGAPAGRLATWTIAILPQLDQMPTYLAYNFALSDRDPQNATVRTERVAAFLCPSDPNGGVVGAPDSGPGRGLPYASSSYRAVSGASDGRDPNDAWFDNPLVVGPYLGGAPPLPAGWRGVLHVVGGRGRKGTPTGLSCEGMAAITDGASHTVVVSEYQTRTHPGRATYWAYGYHSYNQSSAVPFEATFVPDYDRCAAAIAKLVGPDGSHICKRAFAGGHPGILNALRADGSAGFVAAGVDKRVWMAAATIQGGEATAPE
jgi:prepilin-type N-terminal cleavage/methylation domain-containing protein